MRSDEKITYYERIGWNKSGEVVLWQQSYDGMIWTDVDCSYWHGKFPFVIINFDGNEGFKLWRNYESLPSAKHLPSSDEAGKDLPPV